MNKTFATLMVLSAIALVTPTTASAGVQVSGPSVSPQGITFVVSCQAPPSENCNGGVTLSATNGLNLGEGSFGVEPGQSQTVVVALNQAGRKLLVRSHELSVTVTVMSANGVAYTSNIIATRRLQIFALHTADIARAIERTILSQRHIHANVTCPALVIQLKGNNFKCIATAYVHKARVTAPFYVTQQNDQGYVTYHD